MKTTTKSISIALMVAVSSTIFTGCDHQKAAAIATVGGTVIAALTYFNSSSSEQPANNITININKDGETVTSPTTGINQDNSAKSITESNANNTSNSQSTDTSQPKMVESNGNYKQFTDSKYGFSFDYPTEIDNIENKGISLPKYIVNLKTSTLAISVGASDEGNIDDVKNHSELSEASGVKNVEVKDLGNGAYLLTWVKPVLSKGYIEKDFFIQDAFGNNQRQYIHYEYNANTSAAEKATAQHIIDSFKPGN